MDTVRIGVIGIGAMGGHHAAYLAKGEIPLAKLTAVCDINPVRLRWARETLGDEVRTFDSPEAFFASRAMDAILIATPHYDHPPLAVWAFGMGYHVLVEKPAGVYTKQVRVMNETAKASGRVFGIMFNQRTHPLYQKVKDLVHSGELGDIKRTVWLITNWYRSQSYYDSGGWRATWAGEGGGVLLNQAPHQLDLLQLICGMPRRVRAFCAFGKYHEIEVEDDVTAYLEYDSGATGLFVTSTGETPGTNRLEISADKGKVVVEDGKLTFWRLRTPEREFNASYRGGFGEPECLRCEIPIEGRPAEHQGITADWVQAILKGTPLLAPGEEGIKSLQISNAMHLSALTDSWADIPVDEDIYYAMLREKIENSATKKQTSGKTMDVTGTF